MTVIDRALRSNLKLRHLQVLVALDEFRHIGRVAEFLSITQPAVSKMLVEIEKLFDLRLFDRSPRGTEPTREGVTIVRFARTVLTDYQRTRDEVAAVAAGGRGRVSVGVMVVATPTLLMPAIVRLKQRSPLTTVFVEEGDLSRLLPRLRVGELDLVVCRLEPGYAAPDLVTEAMVDDTMCLVVRRGHPFAAGPAPGWAALAAQPWVVPPPWASSRAKLEQIFHRHRLDPPANIIETASFLLTLSSLQQCSAIGFLARGPARHFEQAGLLSILKRPVAMDLPPVGMITLRGRSRSPAAQRLIDCLHETVAAGPKTARRRRQPRPAVSGQSRSSGT